jgi:4-hydroxybenzoate-CoA ligase
MTVAQGARAMTASHYNACADLLDRNVEEGRGDKLVFIDPVRQLTYGALQAETRRFARLLRTLGVRREERIALAMFDTVELPIAFLGAIRAGVAPIPLNTMLAADQYAYMLADSRARVLCVSGELLPTIEPALSKLADLSHVIVVGGAARAPMIDFSMALASEPASFETTECHADEPAFWLYSSGSTGAPKGTRHVHASLMLTAKLYGQGVLGVRESDLNFSAAKLFFAYGLGNSLSFPMSVGATTVLNPARPTAAVVFSFLERYQPTLFFGGPTLYASLLHDKAHAEHKGSPRLRLCASAGEALPKHIGTAWKNRFGVDILDGLGSTEMLHIFLTNAPDDIAYGTSGRVVPGYELRLLDDSGHPVSDGEVGELYVRGPTAADSYWNKREKSRNTFQGEWTRTGDIYTRDSDGRYTYCGRADDMFKVSGIWVSPFEVEAALADHPAVQAAAVVAAEDGDGLLKPKAFVVLREGAKAEGLDAALKEHVKKSVGMWKYPRWIVFIEALPMTATGKVQRFKLRDLSA